MVFLAVILIEKKYKRQNGKKINSEGKAILFLKY